MNILVCIKQVPNTSAIKIDPVTNALIRDGVESILNPFDGYALEAAARIKDNFPDTKITVVTMGPPQAETALRECLSIAADDAYLCTDRVFAGSDTLATSYVLYSVIKQIEKVEATKFDAVFCGKQAIDGDTAQVGPEISEFMDVPLISCALTTQLKGDHLEVTKETDDGKQLLSISLPCLLTFTKPDFEPRFANIKRKLAAKKAEIKKITAADLQDFDATKVGFKGSPTKVKKSFVAPVKSGGIMIKEGSIEESSNKLAQLLKGAI